MRNKGRKKEREGRREGDGKGKEKTLNLYNLKCCKGFGEKRHLNDPLSCVSAVVKIIFFQNVSSSTFWVKNDVCTWENTIHKGQQYSSVFTCL